MIVPQEIGMGYGVSLWAASLGPATQKEEKAWSKFTSAIIYVYDSRLRRLDVI